MKHLPLRECGYAIGFLVLLAGLYFGAYLLMVDRVDLGAMFGVPGTPGYQEAPAVVYRSVEWSRDFFRPAHRFDQLLRPTVWDNEFDLDAFREGARKPTFITIGGMTP